MDNGYEVSLFSFFTPDFDECHHHIDMNSIVQQWDLVMRNRRNKLRFNAKLTDLIISQAFPALKAQYWCVVPSLIIVIDHL